MNIAKTMACFAGGLLALLMTAPPQARADVWNQKTVVTFSGPVEIPGQQLPAGTYVFKLLDSQSDRNVVQVFDKSETHLYGTFLTVPTQSKHPKEAAELATWLTDAKQEVAEFQASGAFPSVKAAQTDPALAASTGISAFFNDAPIAAILTKRADGVKAQYKGPDDSTIQEKVFGPSTISLDQGVSGDKAWADAMTLFNQLIVNK